MNLEQLEKLERISKLKEQGVLTEEEFNQEKAKILAEDDTGAQNQYTDNSVSVPNTPEKSLWGYFVSCLTEKYACFKGRARRREFWGYFLFHFIFFFAFAVIADETDMSRDTGRTLFWLLYLAFLIPSLAVCVRRLHDIDESGWVVIPAAMIPFVMLIAACIPSHPEQNKYGSVPEGVEIKHPIEKKSYHDPWFILSMLIIGFIVVMVFLIAISGR